MSAWKAAFIILFTACLWWALSTLRAVGDTRVAFIRAPSIVSSDDFVVYQVRVPRHADNRRLEVAAFDGEFRVRHTAESLNGEASQALYNVTWRLPAGRLDVIAAVYSGTAEVGRAVHPLTVIGR